MNLTDLLLKQKIDPQHVLVLRHRPVEAGLNKMFLEIAAEKPNVFNAYQQTQGIQVERAMQRAQYVASFIGHEPGRAVFIGLYTVQGYKPITFDEYWQIPENNELRSFGHKGFTKEKAAKRPYTLWFNLTQTDFYSRWKGKLIIKWPPLDKNWYRWAHKPKNEMPIEAILEESALVATMPEWDMLELRWDEIKTLPKRWKMKLSEWRGIYYIFDTSDRKGYVGSAYGKDNIYGRWIEYAKSGHGGNRLLKRLNPHNFLFTILERVSPDMEAADVIKRENSWKQRLHTRKPYGLNDN